jgi:hypothetical protein
VNEKGCLPHKNSSSSVKKGRRCVVDASKYESKRWSDFDGQTVKNGHSFLTYTGKTTQLETIIQHYFYLQK